VISGLADATVVVEAPARSGALITASRGAGTGSGVLPRARLGRSPAAAGCLAFLREFAECLIVAGIPQLIEDLGLADRFSQPVATDAAATLAEVGEAGGRIGRSSSSAGPPGERVAGQVGGGERSRGADPARATWACRRRSRPVPAGRQSRRRRSGEASGAFAGTSLTAGRFYGPLGGLIGFADRCYPDAGRVPRSASRTALGAVPEQRARSEYCATRPQRCWPSPSSRPST
jgi:hypothetical protein